MADNALMCRQGCRLCKDSLEDRFPEELRVLEKLFGNELVTSRLPRLNEIFSYTEAMWEEYTAQLPGGRVKYLMIAEAPPWSDNGKPKYMLDPESQPRLIMKALRPAFQLGPVSNDVALQKLLAQNFLLVDSIPFAMPYTSTLRNRRDYDQLVGLSVKSFLQDKLKRSRLSFADDLRIAFAFKLPAQAVLKALSHLDTGQRRYRLSVAKIAVNDANNPCWRQVQTLYSLS